jgi:hypothetical protein
MVHVAVTVPLISPPQGPSSEPIEFRTEMFLSMSLLVTPPRNMPLKQSSTLTLLSDSRKIPKPPKPWMAPGPRTATSQARLANAAFHQNSAALPKTAEAAKGGPANDSETVTVIGKVVDAACYMVHASAATNASHKDYGVACLARGVPLAIATDDGTLYFPADDNQQLKALLNARVRASGTIVEKSEPMELKMPVGDKNQMVVRVEGGYKQITLQTLEKVSPTQHHGAS